MKMPVRIKAVLIAIAILIASSAVIAFAAPGDSNDPLVTLSYITDTLMPEIDSMVDKKVTQKVDDALENYTPTSKGEASDSYILVNVKKNQRIIGGEGTEFVVRSGQGIIVATSNGGLADLTVGLDLPDGTEAPLNHLLLSPRNDSRGIKFTTNGILLIRGTYTVKSK